MEAKVNIFPVGYTRTGDAFDKIWAACSRLVSSEWQCFETHPSSTWESPTDDPCHQKRLEALSCIDKTRNWEDWDKLLDCRERQKSMAAFKEKNPSAPDPISCHEQVQRLQTYRRALFDEMITPQVAEFTRVVDAARFKCADLRLKYFACAEKDGDQAIECLDLNILHGDCILQALAPEEFEPLRKCRVERPNEACVPEKAVVRRAIDRRAVAATDSIGFRSTDYKTYGGPFRTFESLVYPLTHYEEATTRIKAMEGYIPKNGTWRS